MKKKKEEETEKGEEKGEESTTSSVIDDDKRPAPTYKVGKGSLNAFTYCCSRRVLRCI